MAASFSAPHTRPVYRVLKQAFREYQASGNAANINVTTPPAHTAASVTTVAGTVEVDTLAGVPFPSFVTAILTQASVTKGTQIAAVDPVTGAYSASFPGGTCAAGTATATVSSASPVESTTTPAFTLT